MDLQRLLDVRGERGDNCTKGRKGKKEEERGDWCSALKRRRKRRGKVVKGMKRGVESFLLF